VAFNPAGVLQKTHSFLAASARFPGGVTIGEPKAPPVALAAAVMLSSIGIPETTLTYAQGRLNLTVRLYADAFGTPLEDTELVIGQAVFELIEDFCGDFDFSDASVRNLRPVDLTVAFGYLQLGGDVTKMFRIADISIPLNVNDVAVFG